jgi:parallel beta-helix repeat protein
VQGNYIGIDATGTKPLGNPNDGVHIKEGAGYNTIGPGNAISGNLGTGIEIFGDDVTGNHILGNLIGTDVTGTTEQGNMDGGVRIWRSPGNTVGGTAQGSGNVISGNAWVGVEISRSGATGNKVQGNLIGTDITGTVDLGNDNSGVSIWKASGNTVGGTSPEARNIISGNGDMGVIISGDGATGNTVHGNHIGIDVTGTDALGNFDHGVHIGGAASGNTIGSTSGAGNVISGNGGAGVAIHGSGTTGNQILGNLIGTEVLGNGRGVSFVLCSANTLTANTVSCNSTGIEIKNSSDNRIYNNNFINNDIQAHVEGIGGNTFNLDEPLGGNHWSDWTSPDNNGDGFVDYPYPIGHAHQDNLPWACQDGWRNGCLVQQLLTQVESLNLPNGTENSLKAKLENAARKLDDSNPNNDVVAINTLNAFINEVKAHRGKKISLADADDLIDVAQDIIVVIESL